MNIDDFVGLLILVHQFQAIAYAWETAKANSTCDHNRLFLVRAKLPSK